MFTPLDHGWNTKNFLQSPFDNFILMVFGCFLRRKKDVHFGFIFHFLSRFFHNLTDYFATCVRVYLTRMCVFERSCLSVCVCVSVCKGVCVCEFVLYYSSVGYYVWLKHSILLENCLNDKKLPKNCYDTQSDFYNW